MNTEIKTKGLVAYLDFENKKTTVRKMETKTALLSVVIIFAAGIGIVSAAGFGYFGQSYGTGQQHSGANLSAGMMNAFSSNTGTYNSMANGYFIGNAYGMGAFGYGTYMKNATVTAEDRASLAQCETDFADNVSAIASADFGLNVNVSAVNQANMNLQQNTTLNATSWDSKVGFAIFRNDLQGFYLKFLVDTHGLNSTQEASLSADLKGSGTSLYTCAANSSASLHLNIGIGSSIGGGVNRRHKE